MEIHTIFMEGSIVKMSIFFKLTFLRHKYKKFPMGSCVWTHSFQLKLLFGKLMEHCGDVLGGSTSLGGELWGFRVWHHFLFSLSASGVQVKWDRSAPWLPHAPAAMLPHYDGPHPANAGSQNKLFYFPSCFLVRIFYHSNRKIMNADMKI